jgi:hypothetical protein
MLGSILKLYLSDGGSIFLQNIGDHLSGYALS